VVTNIVAESQNKEVLFNRIAVSCGLSFEELDDGEMTRLIYLKTQRRLKETPSMKKRTTLVAHVGPGNTRILLFKKGRIVRYTSYRLGSHRTREAIDPSRLAGQGFLRLIRDHTSGQISQIHFDYQDDEIEDLIIIGYEVQLLTPFLMSKKKKACSLKKLRTLIEKAAQLSDEQFVKKYNIDFHTAEALLPALEINLAIAEAFNLEQLTVPDSDYDRGLLLDLRGSSSLTKDFQSQVILSTKTIAKRYKIDPKHSMHVAFLCARFFEELKSLHNLTGHDALLLHVSAILHEIGGFVSPRNHHKHSEYLILSSEIFGLNSTDISIISQVARYHRQSPPKPSHSRYRNLPAKDRIRVSKMAAILRARSIPIASSSP